MTIAPRNWLLAMVTLLAACAGESVPAELEEAPGFRQRVFYLEAPCTVNVEGIGLVDVEEEYIPGVVACENGNAPDEALKAQAVQARSFLYYKLFVAGQTVLRNSQADQVYSCTSRLPNGPLDRHRAAAAATRGQYLEWENSIVAAFYVAGAIPPNPDPANPWDSCMPNGGNDPTNTQRWITYNRGKTGCDITMTNLGFVPADCRGNPHNRGCASQNGQTCLDNAGVSYPDMLKYFYGDDIVLAVGEGRCGADPLSAEDQFCVSSGDGAHCFDAANRIECAGGVAGLIETCDEGCGEGACLVSVEPSFCTGKPDGASCNGPQIVSCAAGEVSSTEACTDGCLDAVCLPPGSGGGNNVSNNAGGPSTNQNNNGGSPGATGDGSIPPVVGPSPGVEGGCSTTTAPPPSSLILLVLGFLAAARRRS